MYQSFNPYIYITYIYTYIYLYINIYIFIFYSCKIFSVLITIKHPWVASHCKFFNNDCDRKWQKTNQIFYQKILKFRRFLGFLGQIFGVLTFFLIIWAKSNIMIQTFWKLVKKLDILYHFNNGCLLSTFLGGEGGLVDQIHKIYNV